MKKMNHKGLLIVFEGIDGTGKSTQLTMLADYLWQRGYPVVTTREPTDGPYGQKIREIYTNRENYSIDQELELFLKDRQQHVDELITPALDRGEIVLCDRYFLSTVAYQGARGCAVEQLLERNDFAPDPDIVLLLEVPVETSLQRITAGRGEAPNDFEQKENLSRVAEIFASIDRPYIKKIDATKTTGEVHSQVALCIDPLLFSLVPTDEK
jgi:dTMP kinase